MTRDQALRLSFFEAYLWFLKTRPIIEKARHLHGAKFYPCRVMELPILETR